MNSLDAWLECCPEKSNWCRNEQICRGAIAASLPGGKFFIPSIGPGCVLVATP